MSLTSSRSSASWQAASPLCGGIPHSHFRDFLDVRTSCTQQLEQNANCPRLAPHLRIQSCGYASRFVLDTEPSQPGNGSARHGAALGLCGRHAVRALGRQGLLKSALFISVLASRESAIVCPFPCLALRRRPHHPEDGISLPTVRSATNLPPPLCT